MKLEQLHYAPPIITNASHNRKMAEKCWLAGKTSAEIAEQFPEVFALTPDGKLKQIYDSEYVGTGIFETKYMITEVSVFSFIGKVNKYRNGARQ